MRKNNDFCLVSILYAIFFSFRNLFEVPYKTTIWHDQICGGHHQMMLDRGQSIKMKVAGNREEFKQRRGDFLVSANLH